MFKLPYESATLIFNALAIAATVLTALSGASEHIPATWMPYIAGALAVVNVALRFKTDTAVKLFA